MKTKSYISSLSWTICRRPGQWAVIGGGSLSCKTSYHQIPWNLEAARCVFYFSNSSDIWQAPRQQGCRCTCQISERYTRVNIQSRGFEISRDLVITLLATQPRIQVFQTIPSRTFIDWKLQDCCNVLYYGFYQYVITVVLLWRSWLYWISNYNGLA